MSSRLALVGLPLLVASMVQAEPGRFFFSGDGKIELSHGHFAERIAVRYRDTAGRYDEQALARLRHFFRSWDDGREGEVSLRLFELIDFVQDRYHPKQTVLMSGYRSPAYNDRIRDNGARAAKGSLHTEGMAADLHFTGLDLRKLWIGLRETKVGGVGYYRKEGFLHLDTGRPRFWEPQTSRVEENLSQGNALLFARTDFDRYARLEGAVIRLHSLTLPPVRIARIAHLGAEPVILEPLAGVGPPQDDCFVIADAADVYALRVASAGPLPAGRAPIRLQTCAPYVEATPAELETNPIERLEAARQGPRGPDRIGRSPRR